MTHTNSISFDLAWYTILSQYSASVRRTVCDAVLNFALTGEVPVLKGIAKVAFQFISHEISKQLGRVSANPVRMPVATAEEMPEPDNYKKDDTIPQQPENPHEAEPVEPVQPDAEPVTGLHETTLPDTCSIEDTLPESPKGSCAEPEIPQEKEIAVQQTAVPCPPERQKAYAVPASPDNKKHNCISRSRIPVGKISCTRKGSKILFRRR